jgi:hypothetical protein
MISNNFLHIKSKYFKNYDQNINFQIEFDQHKTLVHEFNKLVQQEKIQKGGKFRPVIIDGCNVGFAYGRKDDKFSAEGLQIAYNYFKKTGYEDQEIIIIQKHIPEKYLNDHDLPLIKELEKIGVLHR